MKIDRKSLELLESQSLAPYGMQSSRSKGRAHPESEPAYRTCFQRDRDRILTYHRLPPPGAQDPGVHHHRA